MPEAAKWDYRYAGFHARRMMRAAGVQGNATNRATFGLFHDGTGSRVIVVRDFNFSANTSVLWNLSVQQLDLAGTALTKNPLVVGDAPSIGKPTYLDTATVYAPDYVVALLANTQGYWNHDFPFAVLLPGWSLIIQSNTNATGAPRLGFIWEAVDAEELDILF
jgi:hypothetical protein